MTPQPRNRTNFKAASNFRAPATIRPTPGAMIMASGAAGRPPGNGYGDIGGMPDLARHSGHRPGGTSGGNGFRQFGQILSVFIPTNTYESAAKGCKENGFFDPAAAAKVTGKSIYSFQIRAMVLYPLRVHVGGGCVHGMRLSQRRQDVRFTPFLSLDVAVRK